VEARQTLTRDAFPRALMVVVAVCATVALAAMGAAVSKGFGASGASVRSVGHPAAGTVLRQDNPAQSSSIGHPAAGTVLRQDNPAQSSSPIKLAGRSGGTQIEDSNIGLSAVDGNGSQSDLTRVLPTQGYNPGWDAKSVREGHGQ
jgi:hypothetical protein